MTTEWLLSGNNPQESMTHSHPLSMTKAMAMGEQYHWVLVQMAGGDSDFDLTLDSLVSVQGWLYMNVDYYVRNAGSIFSFDTSSMGIPPELVKTEAPKPALINQFALLPRFYRLYTWANSFYKSLSEMDQQLSEVYWKLLENPDDPLPLIWPLFNPAFCEHDMMIDRAHVVSTLVVIALDTLIRKQEPELLELFTGQATTTSLIGHRLWDLRRVAEECGEDVVQQLKKGSIDLESYKAQPEAAPLVAGIKEFLKDYGHRGFQYELDYATERLVDRPASILLAIASQLHASEPPDQRAAQTRAAALAVLNALNPIKRALWKRLLEWGQRVISRRENSKSNLALQRALYGLAAKRLAQHFYPDEPEDAMLFYTWEELLLFGKTQGHQRVAPDLLSGRRKEYELEHNQIPPGELIWFNPETRHWRLVVEEGKESPTHAVSAFKGIAASAGRGPVEGVAVVTNDALDAGKRLLDMEGPVILVTRLTDPAWSSLFARLTGVVTELGGVISHAAIVARENGLPAVVGVTDATKWIRNGQRVRVDGSKGLVEIIS